ncbi:MAG: UDP-N-acetylmuramate dehydrogenase [Deltaproteobacteria bacterium]|nr:UDP-N-acetylmuramate dehydrogenase [Deltaproteobacteria bacterium]MBW2087789.1 UDP-N-acetylmuramate dehydrogenase [Deltaproteobacteria bacterium]
MALDSDSIKWLKSRFGSNVKFDEPMSKHTSLRVGGPADAFVAPENVEALKALVSWSWHKESPYLILGNGTNLLVKDSGITGVVIVLTQCLNTISQTDRNTHGIMVTAMAGAHMKTLCSFALKKGLEGMNFAMGIPGSVGGGIIMNAGTSYGSMERVLESISILLPTGQVRNIKKENLDFAYRKISWNKAQIDGHHGQQVILDGCFRLHPSDPEKLKREAQKILETRWQRQPRGLPSAGCFYKNPASGMTAGELIEAAGLKGKSMGGAKISSKHANFILNHHNASAADFLGLMELVEETVLKKFNINLEREVKVVGS